MHVNRREFLRRSICAALGGASLHGALGNLRLISAAAAAHRHAFTDYKALVCVYLYGGNDSFNTIVPCDSTHYGIYQGTRQGLAIPQAGLQQNVLNPLPAQGGLPGGPPSDGATYGMHPSMGQLTNGNAGLRGLFNSGKAAIVANVGSLLYPITQQQYQSGSVPTPAQLYSHDDQTNQWQTSRPDDANANGWGGRIADMLYSANPGDLPMSITLSGENRFQRAATVNQFAVDSYGAAFAAAGVDEGGDPVDFFQVQGMSFRGDGPESWVVGNDPGRRAAYDALRASGTQAHVLERAFADTANRAIANAALLNAAMTGTRLQTRFPDTDLGNQLAAVALMIKVRAALGMSRQVFFVSVGNYDTHGSQLADQAGNLEQLSQALAAFHAATVEMDVAEGVTAFTASDFGRSLAVNSDGTDHGWGGHHFVVGGAVRGQRFYGLMPSLAQYDEGHPGNGNPDDTGYGQIIPTLAVDQYSATLARWFGVDAGGIADLFPNLGRFPGGGDLGFMA
jgi:uncharacterized protein (DUF1501 family)